MSSPEEEEERRGRVLISKQSLWSRQRCYYYYYYHHPSLSSFDFNQVLNTSIVAPPERFLLFFLPLSNYGMLWALRDSVPRRLVEFAPFWGGGRDFGRPQPRGDRCGSLRGYEFEEGPGGSVLQVIGVRGRKDSDEFDVKKFIKIIIPRRLYL